MASASRSPVRTRTTASSGVTQTLPSPILPVRAALTSELGARAIVMCHVWHAYETGASLYFTVLAARDAADPVGQWQRAKAADRERAAEQLGR